MQLRTARMDLRPITIGDVDLLVDLDADPEVMRYLTGGRPSTREEVATIVEAAIGSRWIAFERATGEFIGWFAVWPSAPTERELGYRLRRSAWGRGLATEGAQALVRVAFEQLGAMRVWAETMAVNVASRRVMERCGLRFIGPFHGEWTETIEGSEHGDVEYALTRDEWEVRRR